MPHFSQSLLSPITMDRILGLNHHHEYRPGHALEEFWFDGVLLVEQIQNVGDGLALDVVRSAAFGMEETSVVEDLSFKGADGKVDGV